MVVLNKGSRFYAIEAALKNHNEAQAAKIIKKFADGVYTALDSKKLSVFKTLQIELMKIVEIGGKHHGIHRVIPIEDGPTKAEIVVVLQNGMRLSVKNDVSHESHTQYQEFHSVVTLTIPHLPEGPSRDLTCLLPWREGGLDLVK